MSNNAVSINQTQDLGAALEKVLIGGDLKDLSSEQRVVYVKRVCESIGVNYLTKPFEFIVLNGKLTLYARKDCTDQLRKIHSVSVTDLQKEVVEGVLVVTAKGRDRHGREDTATGAVTIAGLKGDNLANAYMKGETKAKRRLTLSICGLGMLDELELETIPDAQPPKGPTADQKQEYGKRLGLETLPSVKPNDYFAEDEAAGLIPPIDTSGPYKVPQGKFARKTIAELFRDPKIGPDGVANYIAWMEAKSAKEGKPITGWAVEFIEEASRELAALENGEPEESDLPF